jgi:hypothetical protein
VAKERNEDVSDIVSVLTIRALRLHGGNALCVEETRDYKVGAARLSTWLLIYILTSLVFLAVSELRWTISTAIGAIVSLLLFGVFALYLKSLTAQSFYLFVVVIWLVGFGWILIDGNGRDLFVVYVVPMLLAVGVRLGIDALKLAATIPLFIPVVFIVVLAPLLTEDPWRLATEAGPGRVVLLFGLSVIPLTVFAVRRVLRNSTQDSLTRAFERVDTDKKAHIQAADLVYKVKASAEVVEKKDLESGFHGAFRNPLDPACITHIASKVDKRFKRSSVRRLFVLIVGIAISTFAMVYSLAVVAMPAGLAGDWSKRDAVKYFNVRPFDLDLNLPLDPYLSVSLLFATLATVAFLAFASTDDKYADAIIRAVALAPAERLAYMASVRHHLVGHSECSKPI